MQKSSVASAIAYLALHPSDADMRVNLIRVVSSEVLGSIGLPTVARLLLDIAKAGDGVRPSRRILARFSHRCDQFTGHRWRTSSPLWSDLRFSVHTGVSSSGTIRADFVTASPVFKFSVHTGPKDGSQSAKIFYVSWRYWL
jgi:hypothetical protein